MVADRPSLEEAFQWIEERRARSEQTGKTPTDIPFEVQIRVWGYAVTGDVLERSAIIAEDKNVTAIVWDAWDRNIAWLSTQMIAHGDEPYHMPPEHWCLAGALEWRLGRDKAFWDVAQRAR